MYIDPMIMSEITEETPKILHLDIFKGAVCRILTLLKHKNTIICLQIFKKHAKLTYLFI